MAANIKIANIIFLIITIILIFFLTKNLIDILINVFYEGITKSKLKQFHEGNKQDKGSTKQQIDSFTKFVQLKLFPYLEKYLPSLRIDKKDELEKQLKFIGWDDTFTANSYIATNIIFKIIGVILFLVFIMIDIKNLPIAIIFFLACFFLWDKMFNSEVKKTNEALFNNFPEFVRIVSGYLIADMDFVGAVEESIKYVSNEWKPILNDFIFDCNHNGGIDYALEHLKNTVDMFEIKEFVALVKLTIEQGGEVKKSFMEQADKVAEIQKNQALVKIGKRKTLATMLQMPILLSNIVIIGLPTLMNTNLLG